MIQNQDPGLGVQPFCQNHLLLVSAGKIEAKRVDAGGADFKAFDPACGQPPFLAGIDQAMTGEIFKVGQGDIGGNRQKKHQAFHPPFARNVANANVHRFSR